MNSIIFYALIIIIITINCPFSAVHFATQISPIDDTWNPCDCKLRSATSIYEVMIADVSVIFKYSYTCSSAIRSFEFSNTMKIWDIDVFINYPSFWLKYYSLTLPNTAFRSNECACKLWQFNVYMDIPFLLEIKFVKISVTVLKLVEW